MNPRSGRTRASQLDLSEINKPTYRPPGRHDLGLANEISPRSEIRPPPTKVVTTWVNRWDLAKVQLASHGSTRPVVSGIQVHRPRMGRTEFDISDVVARRERYTPGRHDLGLVSWISPRSENRPDDTGSKNRLS